VPLGSVLILGGVEPLCFNNGIYPPGLLDAFLIRARCTRRGRRRQWRKVQNIVGLIQAHAEGERTIGCCLKWNVCGLSARTKDVEFERT
jgi:hypothetical protein